MIDWATTVYTGLSSAQKPQKESSIATTRRAEHIISAVM
jgi:hypothetical protein